jgi:hypothetical protein
MTTNTARETRTIEDQADTAGFGLGVSQQPQQASIIVVCSPIGLGLPVAAPQSLTCRKAGGDQQEF